MAKRRTIGRRALVIGAVAACSLPVAAFATGWMDWGLNHQKDTEKRSERLFGFGNPLQATATPSQGARGAGSVALAGGLKAELVTDKMAQNGDMIAFWPTDSNPEWAIVCIENATTIPGVQRVKLNGADKGKVETILTGTVACDGIRRTAWGTILATEEVSDGWGLEIYKPLETTGVTFTRVDVKNAAGAVTKKAGTVEGGTNPQNVVPRPALGRFAWEGIAAFADGSVYAGDELRPTSRKNGGAIFKFVTSNTAKADNATPANSPYAKGDLYALEVGIGDVGQGTQFGKGKWVGPIDAAKARDEGIAKGTGYYRPEDMHQDPMAEAAGRKRICWTNTNRSALRNYGEVMCLEDRTYENDLMLRRANPAQPIANFKTGTVPEVQLFVAGNPRMSQFDNLEFQPKTGIVYIIEDTPVIGGKEFPGDVWACLPDGADRDLLTDGCVLAMSVRTGEYDSPTAYGPMGEQLIDSAEPTGLIFDASGEKAYLNIQHSPDNPATPTVDESKTDEMLVISGFQPNKVTHEGSDGGLYDFNNR